MFSLLKSPYSAYLSALGLGLLIGVVRERQRSADQHLPAGMRTHTLTALAGAVAWQLGLPVFLVVVAAVALLAFAAYRSTQADSQGQTGEVALIMTVLLGGLSHPAPLLATALAVLVAILLQARKQLHQFGREWISEREVQDGLLLLGAALLILPLLPDRPIDPYGVLNPAKLWRLVVLVMAISAAGHVALRVVGARWGLALAGFFAGFVSSTAAIAGFGQRVRERPELLRPSVGAAMLAALASLLLMLPVLATASPSYMRSMLPSLLAFAAVLAFGGLLGLRGGAHTMPAPTSESRMFRFSHALIFAGLMASVLLISTWLHQLFGDSGALLTAAIAALVELHAAAASVAQLSLSGGLNPELSRWALIGVFATSVIARSTVAFVSGGRAYGLRVGVGLLLGLAAAVMVLLLNNNVP